MNLVPDTDRLKFAETLVKYGMANWQQAENLIRRSKLREMEVREIFEEVKEDLTIGLGLEIPDYELIFNDDFEACHTFVGERKISLPYEGNALTPMNAAHEHAHAYQIENGKVFKSKLKKKDTSILVEGWAVFIEKMYANMRDEKLGLGLYRMLFANNINYLEFSSIVMGESKNIPYYTGLNIFEEIYEKKGFEGCKYAALNLKNDNELS